MVSGIRLELTIVMMRYADIYLLLAECENEIGSPATKAVEYLNKTRARPSVNMPPYPTAAYPTGSKDQIFKAIMHERMVELAGEEARNFDILRWRKAGKLATEPISYFQANKYELTSHTSWRARCECEY